MWSDPVHLRLLRLMKLLGRIQPSLVVFFFVVVFETRSLSVAAAVLKLCRPGLSQTHRDPPASV